MSIDQKIYFFYKRRVDEIGVGPNAVNLREKLCLYYPLWFRI